MMTTTTTTIGVISFTKCAVIICHKFCIQCCSRTTRPFVWLMELPTLQGLIECALWNNTSLPTPVVTIRSLQILKARGVTTKPMQHVSEFLSYCWWKQSTYVKHLNWLARIISSWGQIPYITSNIWFHIDSNHHINLQHRIDVSWIRVAVSHWFNHVTSNYNIQSMYSKHLVAILVFFILDFTIARPKMLIYDLNPCWWKQTTSSTEPRLWCD